MTVQRLDGFVSADAAYGGGEFTTPLIVFDGAVCRVSENGGKTRTVYLIKLSDEIKGIRSRLRVLTGIPHCL